MRFPRRLFAIWMCLDACRCAASPSMHGGLHYLEGKLVYSPPADARAYAAYVRARLAMEQEDVSHARQYILEALQYAPKDAHLWTVRGQIERKLGNQKAALFASQRALELQPDYPPAQQLAASLQQPPTP